MKLVKVNQEFYNLISRNHLDKEILFNEQGRPCVLLIDLEYRGKLRKFVIPMRSNISAKTPSKQYFALPPNSNTRKGCRHGVHYIKLFPIETKYIEKYRINGNFYDTIINILNNKEKQIISAIQEYLKQCESGNRHQMTPDIDGILRVLENPEKEG